MSKIFLLIFFHFVLFFKIILCINYEKHIIFNNTVININEETTNVDQRHKNLKYNAYKGTKISLVKPQNENNISLTNLYYEDRSNIIHNDVYDNKLEKYPVWEPKYRPSVKLKKFEFIKKYMDDRKVVSFNGTYITEKYALFSVTLKDSDDLFIILSTVYGHSIYILMFFFWGGLVITFNEILIWMTFIILTGLFINDIILKNIFQSKRPENSALKTYGMPSGHSFLTMSILTFILIHLTIPNKSKWDITAYILCLILLLPSPFSRIYLEDHTVSQVVVGSIIGIIFGLIYFYLKRRYFSKK